MSSSSADKNNNSTAFIDDDDDDACLTPTLESLVTCDTLRWIFVGGKGGVGKTTTSCSIAVELAKRRENVLILSTDPAHNLSDAFSQKFSNVPVAVRGFSNLFAMELDSTVQENTEFKLNNEAGGLGKMLPELLSAFPGIDEALSFAELMNSVQTMAYSVIVFDTAPTGHTLRLLSFPDLLEKGLKKLTNLREKMSGALNMMSSMAGGLINEEEIHAKLDSLRAVTTSVRTSFQDAGRTTFVCVCIPEFLSVYETERLVQELAKHGIDSSNIVVNQVLFPIKEADDIKIDETLLGQAETSPTHEALTQACRKIKLLEKSFSARRRMQSKYLQQIEDLYTSDFHVVAMPLLSEEVRGVDKLSVFGKLLLEERPLPILRE